MDDETSAAAGAEAQEAEAQEKEKEAEMKSEKKINVFRFLQKKPQPTGFATLLKNHHGKEAHTVAEWESLLTAILNKKV